MYDLSEISKIARLKSMQITQCDFANLALVILLFLIKFNTIILEMKKNRILR